MLDVEGIVGAYLGMNLKSLLNLQRVRTTKNIYLYNDKALVTTYEFQPHLKASSYFNLKPNTYGCYQVVFLKPKKSPLPVGRAGDERRGGVPSIYIYIFKS